MASLPKIDNCSFLLLFLYLQLVQQKVKQNNRQKLCKPEEEKNVQAQRWQGGKKKETQC